MSQRIKLTSDTDTDRTWLKQFSRYLATGFLSVGIEFPTLLCLVEIYEVNYLIANSIAFIITNLCNYFVSRHWVFEKGKHQLTVEVLIFFMTASMGLAINQFILWGMVAYLFVDYRVAKIVAVIVVTIWNFWARKKLVFKG